MPFCRKIRFHKVRHNDLYAYTQSGYGGAPIHSWPFYEFICLYLKGEEDLCIEKWSMWLVDQFNQFKEVEKTKGGMHLGSVHLYAAEIAAAGKIRAQSDPSVLNGSEIRYGAEKLVRRRLTMVDSVIKDGYQPCKGDKVKAVKIDDTYILKGGHHRAATLYALGKDIFPEVTIYRVQEWRFKQCLTTMRSRISSTVRTIIKSG